MYRHLQRLKQNISNFIEQRERERERERERDRERQRDRGRDSIGEI